MRRRRRPWLLGLFLTAVCLLSLFVLPAPSAAGPVAACSEDITLPCCLVPALPPDLLPGREEYAPRALHQLAHRLGW